MLEAQQLNIKKIKIKRKKKYYRKKLSQFELTLLTRQTRYEIGIKNLKFFKNNL